MKLNKLGPQKATAQRFSTTGDSRHFDKMNVICRVGNPQDVTRNALTKYSYPAPLKINRMFWRTPCVRIIVVGTKEKYP